MDSSPAWTRYEEGDGEEAKDLGEGKKCRCQDFEKLPAFPFGPTTALHHPRFVVISALCIGDLCSIDQLFIIECWSHRLISVLRRCKFLSPQ
jgi:hypothetical protein